MSKNVTEYLMGAAAFSIIVLIFVRIETSLLVTFLMIFANLFRAPSFVESVQEVLGDGEGRMVQIMAKQADRMNRLVEDLMSLSRIEMNAHVVPETSCDIHAIALDVNAALEPVARKANVSVEASLVPGQKLVQGDHDQLMQVATNLIDNAIKYGGGEVVKVFEAPKNEKYPRMVGISVEDQGPGISREHLHRLTERFYRTNVAQSRNAGGTGLGLAIVKHILNRHGGELQIESQEEKGSRFTFWVPEYDETVTKTKQREPEDELNVANIMS